MSVVLVPPGLAAFQNCFCAEYLFMGHSLNRQSEGEIERAREQKGERAQERQTARWITIFHNAICSGWNS